MYTRRLLYNGKSYVSPGTVEHLSIKQQLKPCENVRLENKLLYVWIKGKKGGRTGKRRGANDFELFTLP